MRLSADQVKRAVLHPDRDVRDAAVYYFARSYSPDPGIMPLAIQVIDQLGAEQAFETYSFMQDLVQTEETVSWLVDQLKRSADCTTEREQFYFDDIRAALIHSDSAVVQQHESKILTLEELDSYGWEAIEERIWFRSRSPEELWSDLQDFCQMCEEEDEEEVAPEKLELAYHLVEALACHPSFSVPKIVPILNHESDDAGTWIELFAVRLAGELKLQEAVPQIVGLLNDPDDWIGEECHRALVKTGGDLVVTELARQYPEGEFDLRSSAANIFENIHTDVSVQTCLRLFDTEDDHDIRCSLLQSALLNFCTDGIEPARQLILTTPIDIEVLEVRSDLLTACKLLGETFPEFNAWQEDSKNDREFRPNWYKKLYHLDEDFDWDEDLENDEEFEVEGDIDEPVPPPTTIVREGGRIGRNDPCPCGSGKKYKNCCLRNRTPDPETDVQNAAIIGGAADKKAQYPIGTVAIYGPDDKVTTKIVAGVIRKDGAEPILERWVGSKVRQNPKVQRQIQEFFDRFGVKSVAVTEGNLGCPHEEGEDFPLGEDCPFCPFWAGKQGSNRRD